MAKEGVVHSSGGGGTGEDRKAGRGSGQLLSGFFSFFFFFFLIFYIMYSLLRYKNSHAALAMA